MGTLVGGSGAGRPTSARPVSATSATSFGGSAGFADQREAIARDVLVFQSQGGHILTS